MYPEEQAEQAAYQPRVAGRLASSEGLKSTQGYKQSGVMGLTEAEFTALEQLKQNVGVLEKKLQPILEPVPSDSDGNKMAEPDMNKATGRLMSIIEMTMSINRRVEQLCREVNI